MMNQQEYREILAMHGYQSSDEGSDEDSKADFDEIYESYKPQLDQIDPSKDTIIEIKNSEEEATYIKAGISYAGVLEKKNPQDVQKNEVMNGGKSAQDITKPLSKKQRKRQNAKLRKKKLLEDEQLQASSPKNEVMKNQNVPESGEKSKLKQDVDDDCKDKNFTEKSLPKEESRVLEKQINNGVLNAALKENKCDQCENVHSTNETCSMVIHTQQVVLPLQAIYNQQVLLYLANNIEAMLLAVQQCLDNTSQQPAIINAEITKFVRSLEASGIPVLRCCHCTNNVTIHIYELFYSFLQTPFSLDNVQNFFHECDSIILEDVQKWSFVPKHASNTFDLKVHQRVCLILQNMMKKILTYVKVEIRKRRYLWSIENKVISKYIFGNPSDFHLGKLAQEIFEIRRLQSLVDPPIQMLPKLGEVQKVPEEAAQNLQQTLVISNENVCDRDQCLQNVLNQILIIVNNFERDFSIQTENLYSVTLFIFSVITLKRFLFDCLFYLLSFVDVGIDVGFCLILFCYVCALFIIKY